MMENMDMVISYEEKLFSPHKIFIYLTFIVIFAFFFVFVLKVMVALPFLTAFIFPFFIIFTIFELEDFQDNLS